MHFDIITPLYVVETDTLFLEWLTFCSMGKWCVAWFKLHLGCNQDGCLFYGFLLCLLFFLTFVMCRKLQDVLLKSNTNWENKKLSFKNVLTKCSLLLHDGQHNLVSQFKIGVIFQSLMCKSGNKNFSTFKTFYSQFCNKNLTITGAKKASESFCSPSAWIP